MLRGKIMVSELFINSTSVTAGIVNGLVDITGNYFTAMMLLVILLCVLALALQLPIEVTTIFVLPFLLSCYAFVPDFTAVTGTILIYLGIIVAKNFMIK
jgi:hypothetical protein